MPFTLDDLLKAMDQIRSLGPLTSVLRMNHATGELSGEIEGFDSDREMLHTRAMIQSMTNDERQHPDRINLSRRNRIAHGSGTEPADVEDFLEQFNRMSGMMRRMSELSGME
jgi:signal recognition particle subunit SRP54